ncbi:unnamed protein product [Meloidogyne enterolobii]|uniref:Uncharacterized protein n=1 Tax=Meloidogyne enterolobii TaxID=390850 RepID=A0ACB0YL97_MELEN
MFKFNCQFSHPSIHLYFNLNFKMVVKYLWFVVERAYLPERFFLNNSIYCEKEDF